MSEAKKCHFGMAFESLNKFRQDGFICDFMILVDGTGIKAHRSVVAACSPFFEKMLQDDGVVENGRVVLVDFDAETVRQCVEYMYTGEVEVTVENAERILQASKTFEMHEMTKKCCKILADSLTTDNCFDLKKLAIEYESEELNEKADEFVIDNFKHAVKREGFVLVSARDVIKYANCCGDHSLSWKAITRWFEYDSENRHEELNSILDGISYRDFPFDLVLEKLKSNLVCGAEERKMTVIHVICHKILQNAKCLTVKNCLIVKRTLMSVSTVGAFQAERIVDEFIAKHLMKVHKNDDFLELRDVDILRYLRSPAVSPMSEKVKWNIVVDWVGHDPDSREVAFEKLFPCLDINRFSSDFIQSNVLTEPLVAKSHFCKDIVIKALFESRKSKNSWIVLIDKETLETTLLHASTKQRFWQNSNIKLVQEKGSLGKKSDLRHKSIRVQRTDTNDRYAAPGALFRLFQFPDTVAAGTQGAFGHSVAGGTQGAFNFNSAFLPRPGKSRGEGSDKTPISGHLSRPKNAEQCEETSQKETVLPGLLLGKPEVQAHKDTPISGFATLQSTKPGVTKDSGPPQSEVTNQGSMTGKIKAKGHEETLISDSGNAHSTKSDFTFDFQTKGPEDKGVHETMSRGRIRSARRILRKTINHKLFTVGSQETRTFSSGSSQFGGSVITGTQGAFDISSDFFSYLAKSAGQASEKTPISGPSLSKTSGAKSREETFSLFQFKVSGEMKDRKGAPTLKPNFSFTKLMGTSPSAREVFTFGSDETKNREGAFSIKPQFWPNLKPNFSFTKSVGTSSSENEVFNIGSDSVFLPKKSADISPAIIDATTLLDDLYCLVGNTLFCLEIQSRQTWFEVAPTPYPVSRDVKMVACDNAVYLISDKVLCFSLLENRWIKRTNRFAKIAGHCVVCVGTDIYVIGGWRSYVPGIPAFPKGVDKLDTLVDIWNEVPQTLYTHDEATACELRGLIYVIGGNLTSAVEFFNPTCQMWTEVASLKSVGFGLTSGVLDGKLFVFGGKGGGTSVYNEEEDVWKEEDIDIGSSIAVCVELD